MDPDFTEEQIIPHSYWIPLREYMRGGDPWLMVMDLSCMTIYT